MAITGIVPKIVGVALKTHAREQAVQLAVRVILNFLPNSLTQVHTTILSAGYVGLGDSKRVLKAGERYPQGPLLNSF